MNIETLSLANSINKKIKDLDAILNSFQWDDSDIVVNLDRRPSIIIEFDDWDGGKDQLRPPMPLSNELIELIKKEVETEKIKLISQFEKL